MKHSSSKRIRDERSENVTTTPVTASPASDAEFCDSPGAFQRFALRRSHLYQLHKDGLIRGVSLRRRGAARGRRLWSIDSIRSYLNSPKFAVRAPQWRTHQERLVKTARSIARQKVIQRFLNPPILGGQNGERRMRGARKEPRRECVACGARVANPNLGGHDGRPLSGLVWCYRCADRPRQLLLPLRESER